MIKRRYKLEEAEWSLLQTSTAIYAAEKDDDRSRACRENTEKMTKDPGYEDDDTKMKISQIMT